MGCPDDDVLNGWLEAALSPALTATVKQHVEGCARCRELVAALDPQRTEQTAPRSLEPSALTSGSRVGRFEVLRPLGEGGMGLTFLARDPQLEREVCLKVLKPLEGVEPAVERERLLSEARAQARLSHPAIVPVYEVAAEGDFVALVMELVEHGESLRRWLKMPHPVKEVLLTLVQAGEGLVAAHAAGVVHRDFKPDNVMISNGRARIIDFGLARHVVEFTPPPTGMPAAPVLNNTIAAGTPGYMAPEQFDGLQGDARVDQYAFCVTLYEALVGKRPFARPQLSTQLAAQLTEMPPQHPRVSQALWEVLCRGLAARPEQRFPSMEALLDALRSQPPPRPARRWALVAALTLACLGAAGVAGWRAAAPADAIPVLATSESTDAGAPTPGRLSTVVPASEPTAAEQLAEAPEVEASPDADPPEPVPPSSRRARPAMVAVQLQVTPAVSVWWRGRLIGKAPGRVELPPGPQSLELVSAELHARRRVSLRVAPGASLSATLATGVLEFRVSPWAYVSLDGKPLGSTPVAAQTLWEGPHEVVLERPDLGYRATQKVTITPGGHEVLRKVVAPP